jgi:hypothetical protein
MPIAWLPNHSICGRGGISRDFYHTSHAPYASTLYCRLYQAYASGSLLLIKHIHTLLAIADGKAVSDVAQMLTLGERPCATTSTVFSGVVSPV